eukprot:COSAG05_NODE_6756_length_907_cov_1.065594_2_plen_193_part_00
MTRLTNGHEKFRCEKCPEVDFAWVGSLVVLVGALVIITQTKRLVEKIVGKDPQVLVVMAVIRSAWQPMRTLITYMQVGTQVGPVLSIEFPPMFAAVTQRLSEYVELVDVFVSAECAGLDGFHVKWLSQVVIMPVTMVCIVGGVFLFERSRFIGLSRTYPRAGTGTFRQSTHDPHGKHDSRVDVGSTTSISCS